MNRPVEQASSAPRLPGGGPNRFLIPRAHLPPGLAERVGGGEFVPAEARAAATVVLAREGADGVEALLLRRPRRSSFAADAWVFPGGMVDPEDASAALAARSVGPPPEEWAARLGLPDPLRAFAYVVAALREAWEETGILLADGGIAEAGTRGAGFEELIRRYELRLATDDLLYIAHWITPEPEARRYDTRFFLARVGPGEECELHGDELVEARWMRPADSLAAFERGELRLLPPTVHTLRRVAAHASLDSLWHALRDAPVPTFLPRMREEPEGVVIEF